MTLSTFAFGQGHVMTTIGYTGKFVTDTAQGTGVHNIVAYGTQGGALASRSGGLGAEIRGGFTRTAGETLTIAVGGAGGGSFNGGLMNADFVQRANVHNGGAVTITALSPTTVPEPASPALLGTGLCGLGLANRRRVR